MKQLFLMVLLSTSTVFAKDFKTEKSKFNLSAKDKHELCADYADEHFCGSGIDTNKCENDFEFSGTVKHIEGNAEAVTQKTYKMKSKIHDIDFTKKVHFNVSIKGNKLKSTYLSESYSLKGTDSKEVAPAFVKDSSCKGDGDHED